MFRKSVNCNPMKKPHQNRWKNQLDNGMFTAIRQQKEWNNYQYVDWSVDVNVSMFVSYWLAENHWIDMVLQYRAIVCIPVNLSQQFVLLNELACIARHSAATTSLLFSHVTCSFFCSEKTQTGFGWTGYIGNTETTRFRAGTCKGENLAIDKTSIREHVCFLVFGLFIAVYVLQFFRCFPSWT